MADSAGEFWRRCYVRNGVGMSDDREDEGAITIQSLSIAQLIQILRLDDCDDELTQMVEDELARRKTGGACQ
jgi:hypothetical protein